MARTPDGPPPAPVVQRLRIRYAKRGRLRFSSHRDFQRALERALRRASAPMAYSAGFSPHPRISYVGAAPTGTASEAEYVEIALAQRRDPAQLQALLDTALPNGLDVIEVVEAGAEPLAERITGSVWQIDLLGTAPDEAERAVAAFLAADQVPVERLTKNGVRVLDARAAVVRLVAAAADEAADEDPYAILRLVVRHGTPSVRPDDVLTGLRRVADLAPPTPPLVTRLAQGTLDEGSGTVADPLLPDRAGLAPSAVKR
jgi:radical SAM-linked protein